MHLYTHATYALSYVFLHIISFVSSLLVAFFFPPCSADVALPTIASVAVARQAVKQAIMQCALQLKGKITRVQAAREQLNRKKAMVKYIPSAATAIFAVSGGDL
jgi:DNA topoisomerase VI subunit B